MPHSLYFLLLLLHFLSPPLPATATVAWISTSENLGTSSATPPPATLEFHNLVPNAIFARPQAATKTGIPYHVTSHPVTDPTLVVCFVVQHLNKVQKTCPGTQGLLIVDQLGTPTITAVLLRRSTTNTDDGLFIAWASLTIHIVDERMSTDYTKRMNWSDTTDDDRFSIPPPWFHSVVVLNLKHRPSLLQQMMQHISDTAAFPTDVRVLRHEAVDGVQVDVEDLFHTGKLSLQGKQDILHGKAAVEAITLTLGGVGCALSHIELWEMVRAQGEGEGEGKGKGKGEGGIGTGLLGVLILEDDVRISPLLQETMQSLALPEEYDIVYLSFPDYGRRTTRANHRLQRVLGDNWGTGGYILSARGAKTLLQHVYPLQVQIDAYLVQMVTLGWDEGSGVVFDAWVVELPLVRELKSLHRSDIQRGEDQL